MLQRSPRPFSQAPRGLQSEKPYENLNYVRLHCVVTYRRICFITNTDEMLAEFNTARLFQDIIYREDRRREEARYFRGTYQYIMSKIQTHDW